MIIELVSWFAILTFGVGSSISLASSGHPDLAWVSALSWAAGIAGMWYLPKRRCEKKIQMTTYYHPMTAGEALLIILWVVGFLGAWILSLKPDTTSTSVMPW